MESPTLGKAWYRTQIRTGESWTTSNCRSVYAISPKKKLLLHRLFTCLNRSDIDMYVSPSLTLPLVKIHVEPRTCRGSVIYPPLPRLYPAIISLEFPLGIPRQDRSRHGHWSFLLRGNELSKNPGFWITTFISGNVPLFLSLHLLASLDPSVPLFVSSDFPRVTGKPYSDAKRYHSLQLVPSPRTGRVNCVSKNGVTPTYPRFDHRSWGTLKWKDLAWISRC
jgi:hypothetical protein